MNSQLILDIRQQNAQLTDGEFISWANELLYTPMAHYVNYRDIRALLEPRTAQATTEAVMAAVEKLDRLVHAMLLLPGDEFGVGGGWDMSSPEMTAIMDELAAQRLCTDAELAALRDLGRVGHRRCEVWGCSVLTAAMLTEVMGGDEKVKALVAAFPKEYHVRALASNDCEIIAGSIYLHYATVPTAEKAIADMTHRAEDVRQRIEAAALTASALVDAEAGEVK